MVLQQERQLPANGPAGARPGAGGVAGNLLRHRQLVWQLARRSFAAQHAGHVLGWGWGLIATAVQLAIFYVVFSTILGIRIASASDVPFSVYLMTGLVPFLALSDMLVRPVGVLRGNAALVERVRFPAETLVLGDQLGALAHHLLALLVVIAVCVATGTVAVSALGWSVLGLLALLGAGVGGGLLLSVAGVVLPDLREILGLALQAVFYGAPIVYPLSLMGDGLLRDVISSNPVTVLVTLMRAGLLGTEPPSSAAVVVLLGESVVLLVVGAAVFARARRALPDLL